MPSEPPTLIAFGAVCHDTQGRKWVCTGSRVTSVGTRSYFFTRELHRHLNGAHPWMYNATQHETLRRKFPDLAIAEG